MKKVKILVTVLALGLGGIAALSSCGGDAAKEISSSESAHVHVFKEGSHPCQERTCLECGSKVEASQAHSNALSRKVEPTCDSRGYSVYVCSECGTTTKSDYAAALGHDYVKGITVEPTCSSVGYTIFSCSRCSDEYKEYAPQGEHVYDESKTVVEAPTCTHYGKTVKHCSICDEDIVTDYSAPLGHKADSSKDVVVAPTCLEEGYTSRVCSTCGETFKDTFLEKIPHEYLVTKVIAPTCEHSSYVEKICLNCGHSVLEGDQIQKEDHSFGEDGVCTGCGKTIYSANFLSFEKGGAIIPCLESSNYDHIVYSESGEESLTCSISESDLSYLLSHNVTGIFVQAGSQDQEDRNFKFQAKTGSSEGEADGSIDFDFSRFACLQIPFYGTDGGLSKNIVNGKLNFTITHQKGEDAIAELPSFAFRSNIVTSYSDDDPSSYLMARSSSEANVAYVEGKGYRLDYLGQAVENSFPVYVRPELLQKKLQEGYTTMSMVFCDGFDESTPKNKPTNCSFDFYAYFKKDGAESERAQVADGRLSGGTPITSSSFEHTFDISKWDVSTSGFEMNFASIVLWGNPSTYVGHIYIQSITFGGQGEI